MYIWCNGRKPPKILENSHLENLHQARILHQWEQNIPNILSQYYKIGAFDGLWMSKSQALWLIPSKRPFCSILGGYGRYHYLQ